MATPVMMRIMSSCARLAVICSARRVSRKSWIEGSEVTAWCMRGRGEAAPQIR